MAASMRFALVALFLGLALAPGALAAGRGLRQVGTYGGTAEAVITSTRSGISSIGEIDDGKSAGDSQAAAYARGMSRATGATALGLAVAQEGESGGANAAADLIRRGAGYQGSSIAGDIFTGDSFGASPAEDAIRRTQADNALVQARIQNRAARYGSASPFDV
ncbi:hypothetical protein Rsub_04897 [Raphidocelis subcapitata]|uniref:Uncharacterized protein n=1 Tax=Raphidocelis subcapitata TaxID=307507 RepID=A0A2V0NYN9_9CHLO|nr:hypothetical protein Rsub_04897 [Raphidocelis subcapitata]|eukprot:GBF91792.1 hypothetical protein Rsub_04897 [Raphidocelis subcapitata]